MHHVGFVKEIFRYPVKGMRGISTSEAELYWQGLMGDRRYAFFKPGSPSNFPWQTGRKRPQMIRYIPRFMGAFECPPEEIIVETPAGIEYHLNDPELHAEMEALYREPVQLIHLGRGCFDSMPVSLVSENTICALSDLAGAQLDQRRFRPNIFIETLTDEPFPEEEWLGKALVFGEDPAGPRIRLLRQNVRCAMVNLDPETARPNPDVLKAVVQQRDEKVGLYGNPESLGLIKVGTPLYLMD